MERVASTDEFYKSRSLAGRVAMAFKFINVNFSYLFKRSSCILVPLALVQALYVTFFAATPDWSVAYIVASVLVLLLTIAGCVLFYSFVYTSLQSYTESGYLPVMHFKELLPALLPNAKKLFFSGFLTLVFYLCFLSIAWLGKLVTPYLFILTLPLIVFLSVPLSYFGFAYVLGYKEIGKALKSSYRLGVSYWGATFAMILVSTVVVGIVQLVASLPLAATLFVQSMTRLSVLQGNEAVLPGFFPFLLFFVAFLSMFVLYVSTILSIVLMAFQYGSAVAARKERETERSGFDQVQETFRL